MKERLEFIDFAKGFAMLSIVLMHYSTAYVTGNWSKAVMLGGTGVHLFFVLSGFGLGLSSIWRNAVPFYKKRFFRILLPYYITILVIFAVHLLYPIYIQDGWYALGGHLLLYKMFDESIEGSYGVHFWFISTIIQFYLVFPLIMLMKESLGISLFMATALVISITYWLLISYYHVSDLRIYNSFFLQYLWEFCAGIVLADLYKRHTFLFWQQPQLRLLLAAVLGIGLMGVMAIKGGVLGKTFNDIPASIGYLSLCCWFYLMCDGYLPRAKRLVVYIGGISYELYLIHLFVLVVIDELVMSLFDTDLGLGLTLFAVLPLTIVLSAMFARGNTRLYSWIQQYVALKGF